MRYLIGVFLVLNAYADNCSELRKIIDNYKDTAIQIQKEDCAEKEVLYNLGLVYYKSNRLLPAESLLNKLATDWKDSDVMFLLAKIEIKLKKYTEAKKILNDLISINKQYYPAYLELVGINYLENNDKPCLPVKELNPYLDPMIASAKLACALFENNRADVEGLSKITKEDSVSLKRIKVINLLLSENYHLAEAELRELEGENSDLLKAIIYYKLGKYSAVKDKLLTKITSDSDSGLVELLFYCLYKEGDRETGDALLTQYPIFLNNPNLLKILGTWDYNLGNIKNSEKIFRQLVENTVDYYSLSYLIRILEDSNRFSEAQTYKKQLELTKFN